MCVCVFIVHNISQSLQRITASSENGSVCRRSCEAFSLDRELTSLSDAGIRVAAEDYRTLLFYIASLRPPLITFHFTL